MTESDVSKTLFCYENRNLNIAGSKVNFSNLLQVTFCQFPSSQKMQTQSVSTEKLHITLLYKKAACKLLMKLIPYGT